MRRPKPQPRSATHRPERTAAHAHAPRRVRGVRRAETGLGPDGARTRADGRRGDYHDGRGRTGGGRHPAGGEPSVLFRDDDLLVALKPPGWLTAATTGDTRPSLFAWLRDRIGGAAAERVRVVHRLDLDVSGLLVFSLSDLGFHWLKEDLRARRLRRTYLAWVEGDLPDTRESAGLWIQSFLAERPDGTVESVPSQAAAGRLRADLRSAHDERDTGTPALALSRVRLLERRHGCSLVEVTLDTGRKHQIRAHLASIGHPVVGDTRYGAAPGSSSLLLHAVRLQLRHPATGAPLEFEAAPPRALLDGPALELPVLRVAPRQKPSREPRAVDTGWNHVARWYESLVEERPEQLARVVVPGALKLIGPHGDLHVLDVACGQGHVAERLAMAGDHVVGFDLSAHLVDAARARIARRPELRDRIRLTVADARSLDLPAPLRPPGGFDVAVASMALMNIEPLEEVFQRIALHLRPGAALVAVILHPAFRSPGQTSWGWDGSDSGSSLQYRRVDGYLSPFPWPILLHPGRSRTSGEEQWTWTFHRPLQSWVAALASAGFRIEALEEWPAMRLSESGPRAAEENRARFEIPMFLGFRARLDRAR